MSLKRAGVVPVAVTLSLAILMGLGTVVWMHPDGRVARAGYAAPGDELDVAKMAPYGWLGSKDVGTRFTDGLNYLWLAPRTSGPIKIVKVTPLMDNDSTLRVIGVLARTIPDMIPADGQTGWFQQDEGFPPESYDNSGGVDPSGLVVQPVTSSGVGIEFQIGFEVIGNGKSSKHGVEVLYQYEGAVRRFVVPSNLSICAPATVDCADSDS